jgi:hypothetical protein
MLAASAPTVTVLVRIVLKSRNTTVRQYRSRKRTTGSATTSTTASNHLVRRDSRGVLVLGGSSGLVITGNWTSLPLASIACSRRACQITCVRLARSASDSAARQGGPHAFRLTSATTVPSSLLMVSASVSRVVVPWMKVAPLGCGPPPMSCAIGWPSLAGIQR